MQKPQSKNPCFLFLINSTQIKAYLQLDILSLVLNNLMPYITRSLAIEDEGADIVHTYLEECEEHLYVREAKECECRACGKTTIEDGGDNIYISYLEECEEDLWGREAEECECQECGKAIIEDSEADIVHKYVPWRMWGKLVR